jgi:exodeoxyribonuclease VII large subunit
VKNAQLQIQRNREKINQVLQNLAWVKSQFFKIKATELSHLAQKIELLNPIHILKRGFTITTIDGKLLKNAECLTAGQIISTQTDEALIQATITSIQKN